MLPILPATLGMRRRRLRPATFVALAAGMAALFQGLSFVISTRSAGKNPARDTAARFVGQDCHKRSHSSGRTQVSARGGGYDPYGAITIQTLKIGQELEGIVVHVDRFGATVDFGAEKTGFVPVFKMASGRVNDPTELVKVGGPVTAWVSEKPSNDNKNQLILSMASNKIFPFVPRLDDWSGFKDYNSEDYVPAVVRNIQPFGAFVGLKPPGHSGNEEAQGLLAASQQIKPITSIGETIQVRIENIDFSAKKISVSTKPPLLQDYSVFEAVPDSEWITATVVSIPQKLPGVFVSLKPPSSTEDLQAESLLPRFMLPAGAEVKVGEEIKVRIESVDVSAKRLQLSTRPKLLDDYSVFEGVPETEWITATIVANPDSMPGCFVALTPPSSTDGLQAETFLANRETPIGFEIEMGKKVEVRILSVNVEGKRLEITAKQKQIDDFSVFQEVGEDTWITGKVADVNERFGIFINVKPPNAETADIAVGLLPYNFIPVGASLPAVDDEVKVRIENVDVGAQRLTLSMVDDGQDRAALKMAKWSGVSTELFMKGTVASLKNFGAFIRVKHPEIDGEVMDGLLPLKQIDGEGDVVTDPAEILEEGMEIDVRLLEVDMAKKQISLTMLKPAAPKEEAAAPKEEPVAAPAE